MTDSAFLLALLSDGRAHTTNEIIAASQAERGCGLTVHSRAADLRRKGYTILAVAEGKRDGRNVYSYRLLGLSREAEASNGGHGVQGEPGTGVGPHETPAALTSASRGNLAVAPGRVARPQIPTLPAEGDPAPALFELPARPAWS